MTRSIDAGASRALRFDCRAGRAGFRHPAPGPASMPCQATIDQFIAQPDKMDPNWPDTVS